MHVLVVCRGERRGTPEGNQVHGFRMYRRELRRRLGVTVQLVSAWTLDEVEQAVRTTPARVAFVMVSWAEPAPRVEALFQRLAGLPDRPRLVFLDYFAPSSSPYFGVLKYVDRYVKRQVLRRLPDYQGDCAGGCVLTDYLKKRLGFDLGSWQFGSHPDPAQADKIVPGWNLGVTDRFRSLLKWTRYLAVPWEGRPIAVNGRFGQGRPAPREWYENYRDLAARALEPLRKEVRCSGTSHLGPRQYFAELLLSKIVFSPFGWGEVCFRDYEAVCAGALLVKPCMSHLRTSPDIYVDAETYVATSWDFSDLVEVCRYYLAHPARAKAIIRNARAALGRYFEHGGFVADVRKVLHGLEGTSPTPGGRSGSVAENGTGAGSRDRLIATVDW